MRATTRALSGPRSSTNGRTSSTRRSARWRARSSRCTNGSANCKARSAPTTWPSWTAKREGGSRGVGGARVVAQPLGDLDRLRDRAVRQDECELLAAHPTDDVVIAQERRLDPVCNAGGADRRAAPPAFRGLGHDVDAVEGDVVSAAGAIVGARAGDGQGVSASGEGRAGPDDAAADARRRVVVYRGRAASVDGDVHLALVDVLDGVERDLGAGEREGGDGAGGVAPVGGAGVHVVDAGGETPSASI